MQPFVTKDAWHPFCEPPVRLPIQITGLLMSLSEIRVSPRSIAELSLLLSRIARRNLNDLDLSLAASLQKLWLKTRLLESRWVKSLDCWDVTNQQDLSKLSQLTARVLTTDMLVRIWGTLLSAIDAQNRGGDAVKLVRNVTNGLTRIRNAILSRLLQIDSTETDRLVEIDRMFRRCERWVDVLIGSMIPACNVAEFAYERARAQDFAEETRHDQVTGPNPVEHFISAGLRLNFIRHLPSEPFDEPEIVDLAMSVLSRIPEQAFRREGPLKSLLELRILEGRSVHDQAAPFPYLSLDPTDN